MSETETMRALELAMASPDPAVRGLVLRRQEMQREINVLDSFLNSYAELREKMPAAAGAAEGQHLPRPRRNRPTKASPKGASGRTDFVKTVASAIRAAGQPLLVTDIADALVRAGVAVPHTHALFRRLRTQKRYFPRNDTTKRYSVADDVPVG